jgi:hypothetical protein
VSKNLDKERREWEQDREKARKEHQRQLQQNPILYYCAKIRGTIFNYEMSFEDYIKYKVEYLEAKRKAYWKEEEEDYIMNSSLSQTTDGQEPTTTETKFQESMKERITNIEKWEHGIYDKHKPAFAFTSCP